MANENIKAMAEMLGKMAEIQKAVMAEANKDIDEKRETAIGKILNYLDDVADSLNGIDLSISITPHIFWSLHDDNRIVFNRNRPMEKRGEKGDLIKWYLCKPDGRYRPNYLSGYYDTIYGIRSSKGEIFTELLNLIDNWETVKSEVENGIEKALREKMETIRKQTEATISGYKKVDSFEV